jgi:hypothetical protein
MICDHTSGAGQLSIHSRLYGADADLARMIAFLEAANAGGLSTGYFHVGDLIWGLYQNTLFDLRDAGARTAIVYTPRHNEPAQRLYQSAGFQIFTSEFLYRRTL